MDTFIRIEIAFLCYHIGSFSINSTEIDDIGFSFVMPHPLTLYSSLLRFPSLVITSTGDFLFLHKHCSWMSARYDVILKDVMNSQGEFTSNWGISVILQKIGGSIVYIPLFVKWQVFVWAALAHRKISGASWQSLKTMANSRNSVGNPQNRSCHNIFEFSASVVRVSHDFFDFDTRQLRTRE